MTTPDDFAPIDWDPPVFERTSREAFDGKLPRCELREIEAPRVPARNRPRNAEHAEDWLYERAEEAAAVGLSLDKALQAVRDGYSSVDADRSIGEDP